MVLRENISFLVFQCRHTRLFYVMPLDFSEASVSPISLAMALPPSGVATSSDSTYAPTQSEAAFGQEKLINVRSSLFQTALLANKDSPGSIVRSSISGCRPLDPGSNPGQGANKFRIAVCSVLVQVRTAKWFSSIFLANFMTSFSLDVLATLYYFASFSIMALMVRSGR